MRFNIRSKSDSYSNKYANTKQYADKLKAAGMLIDEENFKYSMYGDKDYSHTDYYINIKSIEELCDMLKIINNRIVEIDGEYKSIEIFDIDYERRDLDDGYPEW